MELHWGGSMLVAAEGFPLQKAFVYLICWEIVRKEL
jgi:hypothetical protein